jgi:hypothetical protein
MFLGFQDPDPLPNSDNWRESLALCEGLCSSGFYTIVYRREGTIVQSLKTEL